MPVSFTKLMIVRTLFTLAVQMQATMLGWRMYDLTRDPLHLGCIGLAEAVPALGFALVAGYIVDLGNPLRIYRWVVAVSFASAMIFLAAEVPQLGFTPNAQVGMLYAASFATGLARAFSQPAVYAVVPQLLPRNQLSRGSAWMTSSMQAARAAGPALGGLALGFFDPLLAATTVCALLVAGGALLLQVPLSQAATPAATAVRGRLMQELSVGARFVFKHPVLLPALSLDMLSVLFGGVTALLPVFADQILHVGANGLGLLRAAPAAGAALMSLGLARFGVDRRAGPLLLVSVAGFGVCIVIFGLSESFLLSCVALALSGMFDSVSAVIRGAAVQLASPDALRGRISAVNAMFIGSSNELGEFESGVAAWWVGAVPAVLLGGGLSLVIVAVIAVFSAELRRLDLTR